MLEVFLAVASAEGDIDCQPSVAEARAWGTVAYVRGFGPVDFDARSHPVDRAHKFQVRGPRGLQSWLEQGQPFTVLVTPCGSQFFLLARSDLRDLTAGARFFAVTTHTRAALAVPFTKLQSFVDGSEYVFVPWDILRGMALRVWNADRAGPARAGEDMARGRSVGTYHGRPALPSFVSSSALLPQASHPSHGAPHPLQCAAHASSHHHHH
jgi:hypothetical protein